MKFTYCKVSHIRVNHSVAFSAFAMLHNHHFFLVAKYFHHPKRKPHPHQQALPVPLSPEALTTINLFSLSMDLILNSST